MHSFQAPYRHLNNKKVVFGRKLPRAKAPVFKLNYFLDAKTLPKAPDAVHYNKADYTGMADPLGNLDIGDCTCAGMGHREIVVLKNTGSEDAIPTTADTEALYTAVTGWNPKDPSTDTGAELTTVMDYVKAHGFWPDGRGKIAGYVAVDGGNIDEVKFAIAAFGGVYTGISLPDEWVTPFPGANGFIWKKAGPPNPNQGHCIYFPAYNEPTVIGDTWGLTGGVENEAFEYYFAAEQGGEVYAILSDDWVAAASRVAPSGFNMEELKNYLRALA